MNTVVIASDEADAQAAQAVEVHLAEKNDQVLPLLVGAPDVSLADLTGGMHELLGSHVVGGNVSTASTGSTDSAAEGGCGSPGHACGCGETDGPAHPELDAREIPHSIRRSTIFGALAGVRPGQGWCSWPHTTRGRCSPSSSSVPPAGSRCPIWSAGHRPGGSRSCGARSEPASGHGTGVDIGG